jgi:DNA-directed RNA polymerase subunit RPC12/RpoP
MEIRRYKGNNNNRNKKCSLCKQELLPGDLYLNKSGGRNECTCKYCGNKMLENEINERNELLKELNGRKIQK